MMKAMLLMTAVVLFQVARPATAAANPCFGVSCNSTTISKLYPAADPANPKVYVKVTDGGEPNLTCGPVVNSYLTLKATHPLFGEIFATLLTATANNKKVTFRIISGSPDCEIGYIVLENP